MKLSLTLNNAEVTFADPERMLADLDAAHSAESLGLFAKRYLVPAFYFLRNSQITEKSEVA